MSDSPETHDAVILGDPVEVQLETSHVTLYWNPSLRAVGTWMRPAKFGENWDGHAAIKLALEGGLELIRTHGATRWIADTREIPVMSAETQQWVVDSWWPRALEAGFAWLAILLPRSTMAKLAVDGALPSSDPSATYETRYFAEPDEAKAWLRSKP